MSNNPRYEVTEPEEKNGFSNIISQGIIRKIVFSFILFISSSKTSRNSVKLVLRYYNHLARGDYLRNRKHVPCFYRVIETQVEVWENEKCFGNTTAGECFHSFFEFSQTFTSVSITR